MKSSNFSADSRPQNPYEREKEGIKQLGLGVAAFRREFGSKLTEKELPKLQYFENQVRDWQLSSRLSPMLLLQDFVAFAEKIKKAPPALRVIKGGKE